MFITFIICGMSMWLELLEFFFIISIFILLWSIFRILLWNYSTSWQTFTMNALQILWSYHLWKLLFESEIVSGWRGLGTCCDKSNIFRFLINKRLFSTVKLTNFFFFFFWLGLVGFLWVRVSFIISFWINYVPELRDEICWWKTSMSVSQLETSADGD